MKKLFFVALMAGIAIGGAYATTQNTRSAGDLWVEGNDTSTPDYTCNGGIPSCEFKYTGEIPTLFDGPAGIEPRNEVHLSDYTYTP